MTPIAIWVKKKVSRTEWNNNYKWSGSYCQLGLEGLGISMGFMVVNNIPISCERMNDEELRTFNGHCERNNISPRPLIKVKAELPGMDPGPIPRKPLAMAFAN